MRWCQCAVVLHLRVSDIKATDQGSRWQQTSCAQCPDLDDFDREARLAPENNWFTRPEGVRGHLQCAVGSVLYVAYLKPVSELVGLQRELVSET